jgi:sugar lactone lactonase YvrE
MSSSAAIGSILFLLGSLCVTTPVLAQPIITTVAGGGPNNMPATDANLSVRGVIAHPAGSFFHVAAENQHRIFRVDATTLQLTVVAGNGLPGFSGDGGLAVDAQLNHPGDLALDSAGNLFVADYGNRRVRRIDGATGIITTVAGGATGAAQNFCMCGPALALTLGFTFPASGTITVYDGGIALDSAGRLYVAAPFASFGAAVGRIDLATGTATRLTGISGSSFGTDGDLATDVVVQANAILVDADGNVFLAGMRPLDTSSGRIQRIDAVTGIITTVAGTGVGGTSGFGGFSGDGGPALNAQVDNPGGLALDAGGNLYIADTLNHRVRVVTAGVDGHVAGAADEIITTFAGSGSESSGSFGGDGGPAATLYLGESTVLGPEGQSVILNLRFSVKPRAAGRVYRVEAFATDDLGHEQGFDLVGTLTVRP